MACEYGGTRIYNRGRRGSEKVGKKQFKNVKRRRAKIKESENKVWK